jgi:hypothetical protein
MHEIYKREIVCFQIGSPSYTTRYQRELCCFYVRLLRTAFNVELNVETISYLRKPYN